MACCHAALAGLAGKPGSGVSAIERDDHTLRAMELLSRAIAMGNRFAPMFATDRGLDPLRSRDDFRLLMMDLAFPDEPFARGE